MANVIDKNIMLHKIAESGFSLSVKLEMLQKLHQILVLDPNPIVQSVVSMVGPLSNAFIGGRIDLNINNLKQLVQKTNIDK